MLSSWLVGQTWGQSPAFESITIADGLSQGMIFDILQSSDGFLWFATKDGLNRYDGYHFEVFTNDPFDPYSLAENTVTALFEDSQGRLWVGLQNKGTDVYDPHTGRFHHFPLDFRSKGIQEGNSVDDFLEHPADGAIWALTSGSGLIRFTLPPAWDQGLPEQARL
ncbi:MAG: hypothetical protein KDC54_08995 [Lewinella sp.]|nr:hypothetical protein [Lewinella sp.]